MTSEQDWKRYALEERRNRTAAQAALLGIVKAWDSLKPGQYDKDIWETWLAQKMKPAVDSARAGITCPAEQLPEDFVRLIIAARIVAFSDQSREALKELDTASEAFAECVPWEDQPERH